MTDIFDENECSSECESFDIYKENMYNDFNISDTSTVTTIAKNKKSTIKANEENGIYTYKFIVVNNRINEFFNIVFYATKSIPGKEIRNAITGIYEKRYVGKRDEDLFFKVKFSLGIYGKNPYGTDLYFDSPESYERHFKTKVSAYSKEKWLNKFLSAKKQLCNNTSILKIETKYTVVK